MTIILKKVNFMKYTHIIKPNIKHIYIKVDKKNNIQLISSKKMRKEALRALEQKKDWIKRAIEKNQSKIKRENIYKDGGVVYLFSKEYEFVYVRGKEDKITLQDNKIYYQSKEHLYPKKAVETWYKDRLKSYLEPKVLFYAKKLSLFPKGIKYRKMKRRLGSCRYDDILTFNSMLAKLSFVEIDYVIVHELIHIKHKNHSPSFWKEVEKIFPNYKEIRKNITL